MNAESHPIRDIAAPGIKAPPQLTRLLREEVANLLGRNALGFPGAQPVSFSKKHLEELMREDYFVCEKSDGIRYLLYLTQDEEGRESSYLIDRKNEYWWLHQRNLHFPMPGGDPDQFHTGTLIDGELVMERLPDGQTEPKFLVFDLLALDGKAELLSKPWFKRLGYFSEMVMKPYKKLFSEYPGELRFQAFKVEMKDMQLSYGMVKMFHEILPRLKHDNDGLIFTCRNTPYVFGTDQHILKWKPPHDNTIDFRLRLTFPEVEPDEYDRAEGITEKYIDYESVPEARLMIFTGNNGGSPSYQPFGQPLYLTEEEWEKLKALGDPLQDRVVECCLDDQKRWRLYRFRDDKNEANHVSTVNSVLDSIQDGVGEADLMRAADSIKVNWKRREQMQQGGGVHGH